MNFKKIDNLRIQDVEEELRYRLNLSEEEEVTQIELEAELEAYKGELKKLEIKRLELKKQQEELEKQQKQALKNAKYEEYRKEDLQNRWNKIQDPAFCFYKLKLDIPNPQAYFRDKIYNELDRELAENRLAQIEKINKNVELEKKIERQNRKMIELKDWRNEMLKNTDHTQLADFPIDSKDRAKYREYRQWLRDLPYLINIGRAEYTNKFDFVQWCNK